MGLRHHDEAKPFDMLPGIVRRILDYNDQVMLVELTMAKDAIVPDHTHPHIQIGYLVSGVAEFTVGDDTRILNPGDSWLIPGGVNHRVKVIEDCVALDIFHPHREDFLAQEGR